jgi:hypothetical protein
MPTAGPDPEDIFWPYAGIDATFAVACDENRDLFAYDASAPLDIQEKDSRRSLGLTVTDLTYASPMGGRVPATLVLPDGAGPFAGLVVQSGMGTASRPYSRQGMLPEAVAYARLGALAILIDPPYDRPEHGGGQTLHLTEQDRREQIQYVVDLRRAVDLLLSRPEVDPQRLAYVGQSGGGAIGGLLAGVEDRLQGYVFIVGDGGIVTHVTGPEDFMWWDIKPKELRRQWIAWMWPIEPIHYVRCAAPAGLLFQNGTRDEFVNRPDALRYQHAGSEPKTVLWYEAGHGPLGKQAFLDRAEWLSDAVGLAGYRAFPPSVGVALIAWCLLTTVGLAWLAQDLWRRRPAPLGARLLWLLTTVWLGPLGLVAYWIAGRGPRDAGGASGLASPFRRALGSAAWAAAGNLSGAIIVLGLIDRFPQALSSLVSQLAALFLAPFCAGWLIFAASRWISRSDPRYLMSFRRPVLAEMASAGLVFTGAYLTVGWLSSQILEAWSSPFGVNLSYPPLWGVFSLAALAGALATYPLHLWLIRRGVIRWGVAPKCSEDWPAAPAPPARQTSLP